MFGFAQIRQDNGTIYSTTALSDRHSGRAARRRFCRWCLL